MTSPASARILIVDDDPDIRDTARLLLKQHFTSVQTLGDPTRLAALVRESAFDVLLLDMNFTPGADDGTEGLRLLAEVLNIDPQAVVVLVTAHSDVDIAVEAMKRGGTDFVTKPWENDRLLATLNYVGELSH
jgi:two-component system response regulator HydG